MRYEDFVYRVQESAGLPGDKDARRVIHAVLGTLGELIYRTEERQTAAQLPGELKDVFYEYQLKERGRGDLGNYGLDEFYNRVKARSELTFQEAQRQTKVVLNVLKEAVTPGQMEDILGELRPEFHTLFEGAPVQKVAPEESQDHRYDRNIILFPWNNGSRAALMNGLRVGRICGIRDG